MLQSELFTKTQKNAPKDETALNAQLLIRGGFVDKLMAGVYTYLPLGLRVIKKIEEIVREEMIKIGGEEMLMPLLHPKANWVRTGRWENYDTLFRFTSHYSQNEYALGPTHEEVVSPLAKKFIFSYQDLPKYVFQIQTKLRDEKRVKSGLLRGREFLMKDLYSFHTDEKDLDDYYEKAKKAYERVFERVGLGDETYLTFASGGTFSKYSHEFQTLVPVGEDTIHLCSSCRIAVNEEIIKEQPTCPECGSAKLDTKTAAEVGNIFKLKTKYSNPFELKYKDKNGEEKELVMGCYGIGVSRLMGVTVEKSHDEEGIIWPESIAPFAVHLLELPGGSAKKMYEQLQKEGVEVFYDETDRSPGEKLVDADLIGIPWRVVVSEKTGDDIEVRERDKKETKLMKLQEFIKMVLK